MEEAHRELQISPEEFDEVAAELGRTLDFVKVPEREKDEVLAAFSAHKTEVTEGYMAEITRRAELAIRAMALLGRTSGRVKGSVLAEELGTTAAFVPQVSSTART